jgi:cysteine desulfurase
MEIYFDNAATTALDLDVLEAMLPYLTQYYGNPSSTHQRGREARQAIESARSTVADLLGALPEEIYFTAGATEADNLALVGSIRALGVRHTISSPIEHKAVLQPLHEQEKQGYSKAHWLPLDSQGRIDWDGLEGLLQRYPNALVSLMHGNNELGNLTDIERAGWLCKEHNAVFHSDTVQTMGRFQYQLSQQPVDFLVGSAHKFHGPKGIGFLFARHTRQLLPLLLGGSQERGLRPGTENVAGIVGLAKALEISYRDLADNEKHLQGLKSRLIGNLQTMGLDVVVNGTGNLPGESMPTVLNLSFPTLSVGDPLVNLLDQAGIAVSGGSACSNLSKAGSHVLKAIGTYQERENIRISLSKYNTEVDVDQFMTVVSQIYGPSVLAHEVNSF